MNDDLKPSWRIAPKLRSNARSLRQNATNAERLLWASLRNHRLEGASFRRQVPISGYIADFVCHSIRLIIELDGGQHYSDAGERSDKIRSAVLAGQGFRILRFSNHDVLTNRDGVLHTIRTFVSGQGPLPNPPPQAGEGTFSSRGDGADEI